MDFNKFLKGKKYIKLAAFIDLSRPYTKWVHFKSLLKILPSYMSSIIRLAECKIYMSPPILITI